MTSVESMHTFLSRIIKERMKEREKNLHKTKQVRGVCCVSQVEIENKSKQEKKGCFQEARQKNKQRKEERKIKESK